MARIAYLSSDVIVSVQPAIGTESDFSAHLKRYAGRKDSSLVAQSADAVPDVSQTRMENLPLLEYFSEKSPTLFGHTVEVSFGVIKTWTQLGPSVTQLVWAMT